MIKLKKNQAGFTLIELMISISVISILSVAVMVDYRKSDEVTSLNLAVNNLASFIRQAQNNALGFKKYNGSLPSGGWGVHFVQNESEYSIFADVNADGLYDEGEAEISQGGQVISLDRDLAIGSLSSGVVTDIVFIPPLPRVTFSDGSEIIDDSFVTITLRDSQEASKSVQVNFFGLIDVVQ